MKLSVIGAGYVGLVSAACFADMGWHVRCIDTDNARIDALRDGVSPIYEPGLESLLQKNQVTGRLSFSSSIGEEIADSEVILLAVGTPMSSDGEADVSYVYNAAAECARYCAERALIVVKSTVPVGTNRALEEQLRQLRPECHIEVCSNPEFLREGSAISDFLEPDRVVIGVNSSRADAVLRRLYQPLIMRDVAFITTTRESAELAKYTANAFLAMKITFINQIANLCEAVGANVNDVAEAIGSDHRIGNKFLHPGPGYGGSCFPKDVAALIHQSTAAGRRLPLVEAVQKSNHLRKHEMIDRIAQACGGLAGKTIAVFGVTFKPNTDDMREAPSLVIVPALLKQGAIVNAYDPAGRQDAELLLPGVIWRDNVLAAATDADAAVILTEWAEFSALDLSDLHAIMRGNILIDLRNVFDRNAALEAGFNYKGLGR